jgi:hypothetical protein
MVVLCYPLIAFEAPTLLIGPSIRMGRGDGFPASTADGNLR